MHSMDCNGKRRKKLTINSINKEINNNKTVKKSIIKYIGGWVH